MKFVEIQQADKTAHLNLDHVALVLPSTILGEVELLLVNGLKLNVKGTIGEWAGKINSEKEISL